MKTDTHLTKRVSETLRDISQLADMLGPSEREAACSLERLFSEACENEAVANLFLAETYNVPTLMLKARYEGMVARIKDKMPLEKNPYPASIAREDPFVRLQASEWGAGWIAADNEWKARSQTLRAKHEILFPAVLGSSQFLATADQLRGVFPDFDEAVSLALGQFLRKSHLDANKEPPPFTLNKPLETRQRAKSEQVAFTMPCGTTPPLRITYKVNSDHVVLESIGIST
ncbi:MAG: hypothetical protein H7Y17_03345 [Chlorobia bacterium]|nr:hypothetical protein [Fimbriimonadaceae bacterium]